MANHPNLPPSLPSAPDVVIVGAGAAGIAAARHLAQLGVSYLIVEAAGRIGGRAYTEHDSFGLPFDHGCAWLQGPADLPHLALARAAGFTLIDHSDAPGVQFDRGRRCGAAEAAAYAAASERLRADIFAVRGDVPASSLVMPDTPWLAAAATWLGPMDHGVDLDQLSSADVASYGDYNVDVLVREGLGALVARSAEGLVVRTGVAVTGIDWSGQGVVVQTTEGDIRARAAIVTVSLGVLQAGAIRFAPPLPVSWAQAIADLPMGLLTKIALEVDPAGLDLPENAFLTRAIHEPLPARAAFFLARPTGFDLCVGFVGGSTAWALEAEGEAAGIAFAIEQLVAMFGTDVRRRIGRGRMTGWGSNALTRGAYVAARPGRHAARAALGIPVGERIFFAGEALGGAFPALLSGAHISGDAAAAAVGRVIGPGA